MNNEIEALRKELMQLVPDEQETQADEQCKQDEEQRKRIRLRFALRPPTEWQLYIPFQFSHNSFHGHLYGLIDSDLQRIYILSSKASHQQVEIDFGDIDEIVKPSEKLLGYRIFRKLEEENAHWYFHIEHSNYGFCPRDNVSYNWELPLTELQIAMQEEERRYRNKAIKHSLYWEAWQNIGFITKLNVIIVSEFAIDDVDDIDIEKIRNQFDPLSLHRCDNCHIMFRRDEMVFEDDEEGRLSKCPYCGKRIRYKQVPKDIID